MTPNLKKNDSEQNSIGGVFVIVATVTQKSTRIKYKIIKLVFLQFFSYIFLVAFPSTFKKL